MSSIDERVVQMQFQNSQFEKGVKESIKSLEELKKSLKLEEAVNGLKKLQEAGDSFSLAKIADGIDELSDRFSAFGTFGARIIENLADTVYNKLGAALKDVTVGQIGSGWQKYADDTKAVQTIMFATGESIENVEAELEKLTWFTDETSYSYTDMVSNISKFTSMKIPLKDARIQMQGIATWAAAAGQGTGEASRAMYNISQAVGAGGMKKIDWKSIENANMATADFKQHAIESAIALGKLNKQAQIVQETGSGKKKKKKSITVGVDNFAETLSTGWFDKEVIEDVLARYGEYAEKVQELQKEYEEMGMEISTSEAMDMLSGKTAEFSENAFRAAQEAKTFEEAIEALRDATSTKWLNIFKLIFGNYEKAKELWTKLANDLYDIFVSPLDDLIGNLRQWHNPKFVEDGLGSWNDFMQGVYDIMDGLNGILITVRDAFSNLIPGVTLDDLKSFSLAVKDFGASFKAAFGIPEEESEEVAAEVKKVGDAVEDTTEKTKEYKQEVEETSRALDESFKIGDKGEEVKEFQKQLNELGYNVGAVDGIYGPKTDAAFKKYKNSLRKTKEGTDKLADSEKELLKYTKEGTLDAGLSESIEELGNVTKEGTRNLQEFQEELKRGSRGEEVKKMQEMLIALGYDLDKYGADGIFGPETQAALKEFERDTGMAIDGVYDATEARSLEEAFELGKVTKKFEELDEALKLGSKGEEVKTLQKRLQELGYDVGPLDGIYGPKTQKAVEQFEKDAGNAVNGVYDEADHAVMGEKLGLNSVVETSEEAAKGVKDVADNTAEASEEAEKYSNKLDKVKSIFGGIFAVGGILLKVFGFVGKALVKIVSVTAPLIDAFIEIAAAVGDAIMSFNDWLGQEGRFDSFFKGLDDVLKPISEWITKIADSILVFFELKQPISDTNSEVMTFRKLWSSIVTAVNNSSAFKFLASAFDNLKTAFTNFVNVFKNNKFTGKGLGSTLLKGLEYIGKGLLYLLQPITWLISKLSEFISFLVSKIPDGISKLKDFWNSLWSNDVNADGILGFLAKIKKSLIAVRDYWFGSIDENGNKKDGMFSKLWKMITGDVEGFKNGLANSGFAKTIANVYNSIRPFISKIGSGFSRLFTGAGGEGILSSETIRRIDEFRTGIQNIFSHIKMLFLGNYLNKLDLSKTEEGILRFRDSVVSIFGKIKGFAVSIWNSIKGFISSINLKSWEGFKKSISDIWTNIKDGIINFFSGIGNGFTNAIKNIKNTGAFIFIWGLALVSLALVITRIVKVVKTVYEAIRDFSGYLSRSNKKEEQKLSEKILQFAASIALVAGSIYVLSLLDPGAFWKSFARLAAILVVLGAFVALAGKFGKGDAAKAIVDISDSILKVSEGLVLLAAAVVGLSFMESGAFWKGFGFLSAIVGLITVFSVLMALIGKIKGGSNQDNGIKSVATAILLLTLVIKALSMMKFETFVNGFIKLIAVMGLVITFTALYRLANAVPSRSNKGLMAVTGAILLLTGIVALLSVMPFGMFVRGFVKLIAIMGLVIVFTGLYKIVNAIPNSSGNGLIGVAGAILVLTFITGLLGVLPISVLIKGIIGLIAIMTILSAFLLATRKIGQFSAKSILALIPVLLAMSAMAAIFVVLANQINGLGLVAVAGALVSYIALVIGFKALYKAISNSKVDWSAMVGFLVTAAGLSGSLLAFAYAASMMKDISAGSFVGAIASLIVMIIGLRTLFKVMGRITVDWSAMIAFFVSAIALAGTMIAFAYAMSMMKDIDPSQMLSFATSIAELMLAFSVVGAIAGSVGAGNSFLGILAVAGGLLVVMAAFSAILSIPGIDEFLSGGAEKIGKIIGSFTGAMKAAEIESFNKAAAKLQSIDSVDQGKVDDAVSAAQSIANFGAGLPQKGLIQKAADFIFGSELSQFSTSMSDFGIGFNSFASAINNVETFDGLDEKTNAAIGIAESIKKFGSSLEDKSIDQKIVDAIFGSELSQFSTDMTEFGTGLNNYALAIGQITSFDDLSEKTTAAIGIAESIKSFGDTLVEKSIDQTIVDAIFNASPLKDFSSDMTAFGTGLNNYASAMKEVTEIEELSEKTTAAIGIAESIKSFGDTLTEKSIDQTIVDAIFNASPLKDFSSDMTAFGTGLNNYASAMKEVTETEELSEKTTAAIGIAESIKSFGDTLVEKSIDQTIVDAIFNSSPLKDFSGDMTDFATAFNTYAKTMAKVSVNLQLVSKKTTDAIGIAESIKTFSDTLEDKSFEGKLADSLFGSEFKNFSGDMSSFATAFNKYSTTMNGITADSTSVKDQTDLAIEIATDIGNFLSTLTGMDIETKATGLKGWFEGKNTKGDTIISTMGKLAKAMSDSSDSFGGLSTGTLVEDVKAGAEALKEFAKFLTVLSSDAFSVSSASLGSSESMYSNGVTSKLDDFLTGLSSLATKIVEFSATTEGVDIGAVAAVIHSVSEFLSLMSSLSTGEIAEEIGNFEFGDSLSDNINKVATALSENVDGFKNAGINFDLGLAAGINEQADSPVTAAGAVAQAMLNKINEVLDEHSPSKETYAQGVNFVRGLVNGAMSEDGSAEKASSSIGKTLLNGLSDSLSSGDVSFDSIVDELGKGISDGDLSLGSLFSKDSISEMTDGFGNTFIEGLTDKLSSGDISLDGAFDNFSLDSILGDSTDIFGVFKSGEAKNAVKETFDAAGSYGKEFKENYSIDKLLTGDLQKGDRGDAVKSMQEQLIALGYNLDKYGADGIFGPETQAAVDKFKSDMKIDASSVVDASTQQKIAEAISGEQAMAVYADAGSKIAQSISEGLASSDLSKVEEFIGSIVGVFNKSYNDFKTAGENFSMGLTSGTYAKSYYAIKAAEFTAKQMVTAIKNVFQTASPSKVTQQIGGYFSQGLSIGVEKEGDRAIKSTEEVANNMLSVANGPLASLSDLLAQDIDTTPTIAPVVDLSNVREASASIRDIFGDQVTTGVSTTRQLASKATIDADGVSIKSKSTQETDAMAQLAKDLKDIGRDKDGFNTGNIITEIQNISDKFGDLAEAVSNMKLVLDTGVLVGETSSLYDRQFGSAAIMRERGN